MGILAPPDTKVEKPNVLTTEFKAMAVPSETPGAAESL